MTTFGTSYFVSERHARQYYAEYEGLNSDNPKMREIVQLKVQEGLIHIGMPPLEPGQFVSRIDRGRRYAITRE
jgi:hypothetical protein